MSENPTPNLVITGPDAVMFAVEFLETRIQIMKADVAAPSFHSDYTRGVIDGLHRALCLVVGFKNQLGGIGAPPLPPGPGGKDG